MSLAFNNYLDMELKDGSDDKNLRRLTDDFGRHKLTDVQEENEDDSTTASMLTTMPRNRYSSIGSTASSMDYLWDLHPRRLSEAGLSRHSDNSTILTEDTDSFIIGQRVWVGGTKPGSIAYIGETQFAPGDWAGIVLDQPIGKNDGSVGGIRYFQCEPKKGVFSRLTRLTRYPLTDPDATVVDAATSTPMNGTRRSPISPSGSISPLKSPPSLTTSNTSLASAHVDYKLGDRVIIKSSQGSKIGTLRFMGSTDFAAGEWCGVELDEPRGKNDGSVGGKRYFDCRPNFGLFAPVSKVSKSPSNRKPGSCVVHSGPGLPPSGFRRANSKESLASNTSITSAASGVRREVLKEKQQHIEQLLKERDLERAEIAKASIQADEAEQRYVDLKQKYDLYRFDCENKLQEHATLLAQLRNEMKELLSNLEDEKRKNEDMQFKFEEAAIAKADLEVANETNLARISELENQLAQERHRVEALEGESNKLFEAEESLVRVREENEVLKYEIEVAAQKIQQLESEGSSNKDLVISRLKELEDVQLIVRQRDELIEKNKMDFQSLSDQYEQSRLSFAKEIEDYKTRAASASRECSELKTTIDSLRKELERTNTELLEKAIASSKTAENAKAVEEKLSKELEKLKMSLSAKMLDLENASENLKKKDAEIKELTSQLASIKSQLETQSGDITKSKDVFKETEEALRKELEESRSTIKMKINEAEEVKKQMAVAIAQKESELREANKTTNSYAEQIEKLNEAIVELKEAKYKSENEMEVLHEQKLRDQEAKNADLTRTLQEKEEALAKVALDLSETRKDLDNKNSEIESIKEELERAKVKMQEESALLDKTNEDMNQLRLNVNDLERKLLTSEEKSAELVQEKTRLEEQLRDLVGSSGDFSNKLDEMSRELREKDKNMANVKNDLTLKLQDMEKLKEQVELSYDTYAKRSEKELKERDDTIGELTAAKNAIKEQLDKASVENKKTFDLLNSKVLEIQAVVKEKEELLRKMEDRLTEDQEKYRLSLEKIEEESKSRVEDLQKRLDDLSRDRGETDEALSKRSLELIEMESKYNQELELSKQTLHELKTDYEEKLRSLEHRLVDKERESSERAEMSRKQFEEKIKELHSEKEGMGKELCEKIMNLSVEKEEYQRKSDEWSSEKEKLREALETANVEKDTVRAEMLSKIASLEGDLKTGEDAMRQLRERFAESESKWKEEISKFSGDLESRIVQQQSQIEALDKEKIEIQDALRTREEEIRSIRNNNEELIRKSENSQTNFDEDRRRFLEQIEILSEEIKRKDLEVENVKQLNKSSESETTERNKEIELLKSELQVNHSFVQKLQAEKKNLLQEKEDLMKADSEKDRRCAELNQRISELTGQLQTTNQSSLDLQTASNLYVTVFQLLQLTEEQKIRLVDMLESTVKNECDAEGYTKISKVVDSIKVVQDDSKDDKIRSLEKEIECYKKKQSELDARLKKQESQIPRPEFKAKEAHKTVDNGNKIDNVPSVINNNPATNEQLMEEKLLAESQVAFLNAIIVDMQKKNEEQKARIEILESGYSPAAAEELGSLRLTDRNLPPRMYCDICEEFDLHETEDCPQQANDDLPARERSPKDKPQPRPYCELCEMFGHATEDCQEDQTF